jgi:subtilase family serine protease
MTMRLNAIAAVCRLIWIVALAAISSVAEGVQAAAAPETLLAVLPRVRVVAPVDRVVTVALLGNRHPEATKENDIGTVNDELRFERMILSLKPDTAQKTALEHYLAASHDPASPQYRQWLTPQRFEEHFGVAAEDLVAVTNWLTGQGFTVNEIPPGHRAIVFSGTAAQIRAAFGTDMRRYRVRGEDHLANATDPQIPAALASVVDGVVSLHDFRSQPMNTRAKVAPDYTSGSTHYLAAADFQTIYNLKPLYAAGINGSGTSIAILGRSNVVPGDIQQYRTTMNLPANPPQIIINGADPGLISGDQGESDLDLEWAGAVAPAATIKFVTSASTASTDGIDLSAQYAVSHKSAEVISLSYGLCETSLGNTALNFYNNLWQQADSYGITVVVSSGDSGAAGCDAAGAASATQGRAVNGLCTSPYSTCVGGTQFADTANPSLYWSSTTNPTDQSSVLSYIPEVVWNESGTNGGSQLWASGGGTSTHFSRPSWQTTPGVPVGSKRVVPDISLTAAVHDGYLVYSSDNATTTRTLYIFGGTSASAPSFAGIMALINQKTGYSQGSANARLYGLASRQASTGTPAYFHLITVGNNSVPGQSGFAASASAPYYNQATGLGSIDGNVLVNHWTDLLPATSTALTATPNPASIGQSVTLTATVTGATPTGSVQFIDGTTSLGAPIAMIGGVATLVTGSLAVGGHSMTASYSGDKANQPSTSSTWVQSVTLIATTVNLTVTPPTIDAGQPVTFTAAVSGAAPALTGTVQFQEGGTSLGAPVTLMAATASITTNALTTPGNHSITAVYSGDAIHLGSTAPMITLTVNAVATADAGEVPTLPQWSAILLSALLMLGIARASAARP